MPRHELEMRELLAEVTTNPGVALEAGPQGARVIRVMGHRFRVLCRADHVYLAVRRCTLAAA